QTLFPRMKRCATIGRERSGVKRKVNRIFEFSRMAIVRHNTDSFQEGCRRSEFRGRRASTMHFEEPAWIPLPFLASPKMKRIPTLAPRSLGPAKSHSFPEA